MEEMLAGKPPTTGERERREAQRRSAGNGGDVGDKTANHSEKKGRKVWWYEEKLLSLHSENSPLQLKGSHLGRHGRHYSVTINFNKFEKPVGAVVIPGAGNDIKDITDIIEIKK